ncbi:hypothetical protein GCM10023204_33120 [Actinomycetospora succinea]
MLMASEDDREPADERLGGPPAGLETVPLEPSPQLRLVHRRLPWSVADATGETPRSGRLSEKVGGRLLFGGNASETEASPSESRRPPRRAALVWPGPPTGRAGRDEDVFSSEEMLRKPKHLHEGVGALMPSGDDDGPRADGLAGRW